MPIDRLRPSNVPAPCGWKVLVKLKDPPGKINNVYIPQTAQDNMRHLAFVVQVIELGPLCYNTGDKFGDYGAWIKPGDWALTSAYAGTRFLIDGHEYRIINDDEIQAMVPAPDDVKKAS